MKQAQFFCKLAAFLCAISFSNLLVAQQFENTFGIPANHEEPQDGKPLPSGSYIVLSNTLSFGPASRILLTRLNATGSVNMTATIHEGGSPTTGYFASSITLDYNALGAHSGYFIAGSRSTANGRQAILIRTNTVGTVSWTVVLPNADISGVLDERGVSVERQTNGDVILTASGYSTIANNHRFSVSRFSSAGVQQWSYRYYATTTGQSFEATEACNAIRSNAAVIVVTGRYWVAGSVNHHSFLSCINADTGDEIWRRSYNSGLTRDAGIDVVYKPANGNEAAALMVVGWAGQVSTALWVIRANPLNGISSSKSYLPTLTNPIISGDAINLDVTGTRAAITGFLYHQISPGIIFSGTYTMVLPFYGIELPDWTYYYTSSAPSTPAPRSISPITGALQGYFTTCGTRLTGSVFNDAHAIRINSIGSNGATGCEIAPFTLVRTPMGTSTWRAFSKTPYTWTNIFPSRNPQTLTQEFCIEPQFSDVDEDRNEELAFELAEPSLYPNPASSGQNATMTFNLPETATVQVLVFDLAGRVVWSFSETLSNGKQDVEMPSSKWANGAYVIKLQVPSKSKTMKFVVLNN